VFGVVVHGTAKGLGGGFELAFLAIHVAEIVVRNGVAGGSCQGLLVGSNSVIETPLLLPQDAEAVVVVRRVLESDRAPEGGFRF
jgi:hypothetical protein